MIDSKRLSVKMIGRPAWYDKVVGPCNCKSINMANFTKIK